MYQALCEYRTPPELTDGTRRVPVIVVGAGPVGLCAAIDLGLQDVQTLVLDEDDSLSEGSRAICFAKRTLEVLDRLGCGERAVTKGVVWNTGKVFLHDRLLYPFDLLPESGHKRPAFINLQQYYLEQFLVERLHALPRVELRFRNRVTAVAQNPDCVEVTVETPDGRYVIECDYLVACDGARSPVRQALGLESKGQVFRDRFLIADVKMRAGFPTERWFWFDPPFHRNQSVLLHRQADDIWRIDFQLGWDANPEEERKPERVMPRIQAMLGPDAKFTLEWVSVYTFQCRRMDRFRHGRVLFAGDAAHQVSPFGARGANSGIQDTDNLAWKLKLALDGRAPDTLLDSYDAERRPAADENILHSTRSTDFITPKSGISRAFRDATLQLAEHHAFARSLVNSGRLSTPSTYSTSPLNTPDEDAFGARMRPGAPAIDAPLDSRDGDTWLIDQIGGRFDLLYFTGTEAVSETMRNTFESLRRLPVPVETLIISAQGVRAGIGRFFEDVDGLFAERYDARSGTAYLLRPDQHVCARWRRLDAASIHKAQARALAAETETRVAT
jgi:3-(3-hydroxy-phenyl)propionate hydroxylase